MKMSDHGRALLREWEGCKLQAYKDSAGVWTIGVGHTPAKPGQSISQFEADEILQMDLEDREVILNDLLKGVPTKQCEFDALLSLLFNIGLGRRATADKKEVPGLITSTVLKRHKLRNRTGAANAFLMWRFAGGKPILLRRREKERLLYLGELQ